MDAVGVIGLAELGYAERELSWSVEEASVRLPDDDLAARVRSFGETHARHAEDIDRITRSVSHVPAHVPDDFKSEVHAMTDRLCAAEETASVLVALVQAERRIVGLYDLPLNEDISPTDAASLERQQAEEQRHVDYLEERGSVIVPELVDVGDADGEGSAIP